MNPERCWRRISYVLALQYAALHLTETSRPTQSSPNYHCRPTLRSLRLTPWRLPLPQPA
jgi:hypothetical protein